jgi:ferredoxin-NADP reductase/mono/diheme cytochrome c family protein
MTSVWVNLTFGALFVLLGAVNVWLIFHASRTITASGTSQRLIRAHRLGGYLFIALFCAMTYFMLLRSADASEELSLRGTIHVLIAMSLAPLLFVKVLIARYYKTFYSALTSIGLLIFSLAFILVALTAGPYLLQTMQTKPRSIVNTNLHPEETDLRASEALMQKRCARCHTLDRVVGARKDARGWSMTVTRMRALPGSHISEDDATAILTYLVRANSIDSANLQGELKVGKALVDGHCGRCHQLDRVYRTAFSPNQWRATVMRMVGYARGTDGFFKPGESQQIIEFLSRTQTPEAVAARAGSNAEAEDNSQPGAAEKRTGGSPPHANPVAIQTGVVLLAIAAVIGTLAIRRPKHISGTVPSRSSEARQTVERSASERQRSVVLELVRIQPEAHDCVTLRFRLPQGTEWNVRPGQFMIFTWLLDGKKVVRSYTISSSPMQRGYVEITPKKVKGGLVSAFLNERAAIGLTVEAIGPAGQFYFDERTHASIVLLAAGSGITPMISILRFIDDRCLGTDVTLLYTVRTERDIIFRADIERFKESLRSFRCSIVLTQPDAGWTGSTGRIGSDLLADVVARQREASFFICGPGTFMKDMTASLSGLGVDPKRIKQEKFSSPAANPIAVADGLRTGFVEFTRSGKTCDIPADSTLLEVAERHGVSIPYSCRQGQCGTCVSKLIEGTVRMDAEAGLTEELRRQGYVLPCVSRAQGDIKLEA